jgi:hypothetical protein
MTPASTKNRLRVATWNLNSVQPLTADRLASFHEAMLLIDADVWVLTETWLNFAPPLTAGKDPHRLVAQSCRADDLAPPGGPSVRRWVAVWSRPPARGLEVLGDTERMACARVERPGLRDVVVVGTVLPWRSDQRHHPRTGSAEFVHALQHQAQEWGCLWGSPRAAGFCVAGDFNQEMQPPHHTGSAPGLQELDGALNGLALTCLTADLQVVYPPPVVQEPIPIIDHVCVGGGLQLAPGSAATDWEIPGAPAEPITDHVGVYVDLDLNP